MYDSSMVTTDRHFTRNKSLDPSRPALLLIDVQPRRTEARMNCPHWLLALTIPFSRSDRAHTSTAGVGAGCSEGLFRTDCSAGKSPSVPAGLTLWGHFRREDYCTRRAADRQRTLRENVTEACPCASAGHKNTAVLPPPRGYVQRETDSSPATQKRQGSSVATLMPIRFPCAGCSGGGVPSSTRRTAAAWGDFGRANRSIPLSAPVMPRA
jgi:hypothetical protein